MFPPVDRAKKHETIVLGSKGLTQPEIAINLNISESSIKRAKRRTRLYGDVEGGRKKSGPKPKFDIYMEEVFDE
jgi:transposase